MSYYNYFVKELLAYVAVVVTSPSPSPATIVQLYVLPYLSLSLSSSFFSLCSKKIDEEEELAAIKTTETASYKVNEGISPLRT